MSNQTEQLFSAPLTVNWTLSFDCNFDCLHCYSRDEVAGELTTDELKSIVDTLSDQQVPFVNFGGGEPLIRKDLFELTRYATGKGMNVSMNSNGWLIDSDTACQIKEAGFKSVGISIDSHDAKVHDEFRSRPGSFDCAVAALDHLRDLGIKTTMSSVISRINYKEFEKILDIARDHGVAQLYLHNYKCTGRGLQNREELDLTPEEWKAFYSEALEVKNQSKDVLISFDDPVIASLPEYQETPLVKGSSCGKLSLHLRPNGDMTPCGFIPLVIGNIIKDDFESVWNDSEVLQAMRFKSASGKCTGCGSYEDCLGGCSARAFMVTGDFNAPDPHCWK